MYSVWYKDMEVWKKVVGCESYEVSNLGNVRNSSGLLLKPRLRSDGKYVRVKLDKQYYVHRLVLTAFVGEPPVGYEASHLNGNGLDNRLANLIWESKSDNCKRRDNTKNGIGLKGELSPKAKLTNAQREEMARLYKSGVKKAHLASMFGVSKARVSKLLPTTAPLTVDGSAAGIV